MLLLRSDSDHENVWTKIANNTQDVWPFKKRPMRTAFTGKKPHLDVKIPLHNGIMSGIICKRVRVCMPIYTSIYAYMWVDKYKMSRFLYIPALCLVSYVYVCVRVCMPVYM